MAMIMIAEGPERIYVTVSGVNYLRGLRQLGADICQLLDDDQEEKAEELYEKMFRQPDSPYLKAGNNIDLECDGLSYRYIRYIGNFLLKATDELARRFCDLWPNRDRDTYAKPKVGSPDTMIVATTYTGEYPADDSFYTTLRLITTFAAENLFGVIY